MLVMEISTLLLFLTQTILKKKSEQKSLLTVLQGMSFLLKENPKDYMKLVVVDINQLQQYCNVTATTATALHKYLIVHAL